VPVPLLICCPWRSPVRAADEEDHALMAGINKCYLLSWMDYLIRSGFIYPYHAVKAGFSGG
jgi:hypothetical protein